MDDSTERAESSGTDDEAEDVFYDAIELARAASMSRSGSGGGSVADALGSLNLDELQGRPPSQPAPQRPDDEPTCAHAVLLLHACVHACMPVHLVLSTNALVAIHLRCWYGPRAHACHAVVCIQAVACGSLHAPWQCLHADLRSPAARCDSATA